MGRIQLPLEPTVLDGGPVLRSNALRCRPCCGSFRGTTTWLLERHQAMRHAVIAALVRFLQGDGTFMAAAFEDEGTVCVVSLGRRHRRRCMDGAGLRVCFAWAAPAWSLCDIKPEKHRKICRGPSSCVGSWSHQHGKDLAFYFAIILFDVSLKFLPPAAVSM